MTETYFKKEVEKYQYIQIPKWLFKEPYNKLSANAKLMYAMLFNRLDLSLNNRWHDTKGQVFMYFTNSEFCEELGCSEKTVTKIKKELKDMGLLHEERQGLTKPNRLYIKGPEASSEPQKIPSRTVKNTTLGTQKIQTIKTDNNKTDINNNILSTCKEILDYLNELTNSNFRATNKSTQKLINARLNEGYTVDDIKLVIKDKTAEWGHDRNMENYLRPSTLFKVSKFEEYLEKALKNKSKTDKLDKPDERLGF
ncbi:conserved phage C-terminal domain-containing protein [Streptococcus pluranimalium]